MLRRTPLRLKERMVSLLRHSEMSMQLMRGYFYRLSQFCFDFELQNLSCRGSRERCAFYRKASS